MKLALLVGANPRVCKEGPVVKLSEGKWILVPVGLVDTVLGLQLTGNREITDGFYVKRDSNFGIEVKLGENIRAQLVMKEAGNEPYIGVFAERQ